MNHQSNIPDQPERKSMTETEIFRWAIKQLTSADPAEVKAFVGAWNANPDMPFEIDLSDREEDREEKSLSIQLVTPLPCACGAPATVASAFTANDMGLDFKHGWVVYPTCQRCALKMQEAYNSLDIDT